MISLLFPTDQTRELCFCWARWPLQQCCFFHEIKIWEQAVEKRVHYLDCPRPVFSSNGYFIWILCYNTFKIYSSKMPCLGKPFFLLWFAQLHVRIDCVFFFHRDMPISECVILRELFLFLHLQRKFFNKLIFYEDDF